MGGVAVGADGVMVEVHPDPDSALSDAEQQLDLAAFAELAAALLPIHEQVRVLRERRAGARRGRQPMTAERHDDLDGRPSCDVAAAPAPPRPPALPGDKSISHRALLLALLADGTSRIAGASDGEDVRTTRRSSSSSGARVTRASAAPAAAVDSWSTSPGIDGLREPPARPRLPQLRDDAPPRRRDPRRPAVRGVLDGDESLRRRPMRAGRRAAPGDGRRGRRRATAGTPPLTVVAARPAAIDWTPATASAQVKSAILLAGLASRRARRASTSGRDARSHRTHAPTAGVEVNGG